MNERTDKINKLTTVPSHLLVRGRFLLVNEFWFRSTNNSIIDFIFGNNKTKVG